MTVQEQWNKVAESFNKPVFNLIDECFNPAWEWPALVRYLYVLFWPMSIAFRVAILIVAVLAAFVILWPLSAIFYLRAVWNGEPFKP